MDGRGTKGVHSNAADTLEKMLQVTEVGKRCWTLDCASLLCSHRSFGARRLGPQARQIVLLVS